MKRWSPTTWFGGIAIPLVMLGAAARFAYQGEAWVSTGDSGWTRYTWSGTPLAFASYVSVFAVGGLSFAWWNLFARLPQCNRYAGAVSFCMALACFGSLLVFAASIVF